MKKEYPILEFNKKMQLSSGHSFSFLPISQVLQNEHKSHSPFDYHQIEFFVFILYTKGTEMHTIDYKDYHCEQGTLLAIRKGQVHRFSNPNVDGYILVFNYEFLGNYFSKKESQTSLLLFNEFLYEPKIQLNQEQNDSILNLVHQIKNESQYINDLLSPSIIRSFLQVIVNQIYRIKTANQTVSLNKKHLSLFIQFQNSVELNYTKSLKVQDYANWLGVHRKTLNNITQSIINKTAKEFIDEICVNNIKRKLTNNLTSIKEICFECGFDETANFNNYFKKRTGETPKNFRKPK